ncbi:NAD(P)-binding protein [Rhodotorula diobovata]|uniref:NAD(P)-binding protein n=1 Tax=Rhodotorula diobovata TaxID=5288 RepID=A0A5C5FXW8_9BASI|nr:NAD(P)-binding protein [Rhodotorula diobovata]
MPSVAPLARVVLITGSSTGFGRNLVDAVLARGDIAVATLRKPEVLQDLATQFGKDRLLVLPLDVTDKGQVTSVFDAVKTAYGRLDVVVNNAGIAYTNEIEGTTDADIRRLFDTNVFAPFEIIKQAVAFMRDVNSPSGTGGAIINISSNSGIRAIPVLGAYSASKFALEGITEAFVNELDPAWNISLHLIEPGAFRTNISANAAQPPPHPAYSSPHLPTNLVRAKLAASTGAKGDPAKAARAILDVLDLPREERPKRLALGEDGYALVVLKARELLEGAEKWKDVSLSVNFDE